MQLDFQNVTDFLAGTVAAYGLAVAGAFILLLAGLLLARLLPAWVRRASARGERLDPTLATFLARVVKVTVLALTGLVVLAQLGVSVASLLALFGAIGLGVGLALKDTFADLAAGVVLMAQRPFGVGDSVAVAGTAGTIEEVGFLATRLRAVDGVYVLLPNSRIWGEVIENRSRNPVRRADLAVGIGYDEDIERALALVRQLLANDPRVLDDPAPQVAVANLGDSAVELLVRPWMATADWWPAQLDLLQTIKRSLDEAGIAIPFPQRDVHLFTADNAAAAAAAGGPAPA